jgi:hypothetical protein
MSVENGICRFTGKTQMKPTLRILAVCAFAAASLSLISAQDSLGDAARAARMSKPASAPGARVYTTDPLPTGTGLGVAAISSTQSSSSGSTESTTASTTKEGDTQAEGAEQPKNAKPDDSPDARQKIYDDWKSKIDDQKKEISQVERELNVLQREAQINAAVYYADAGTQLRDPKRYADEQRQRQADIDSKQKELDDAKQKLADLQDEARKAGVPAGQLD